LHASPCLLRLDVIIGAAVTTMPAAKLDVLRGCDENRRTGSPAMAIVAILSTGSVIKITACRAWPYVWAGPLRD